MVETAELLRRLDGIATIRRGSNRAQLVHEILESGDGRLSSAGAIVVQTGSHTGRSPKDKYIVRDALTSPHVWWDNVAAMSPAQFDLLKDDMLAYAAGRTLYHEALNAGADSSFRVAVDVVTETAWHALFIRNLLIRERTGDATMPALILQCRALSPIRRAMAPGPAPSLRST
jgi:phosphoenolpyruvate carboxykinase (ATP)